MTDTLTAPVDEKAQQRVRKGERSRLRILDAAADLLALHGYAATTLTDIARAAKMQAGSLYYHFDSKDAIVTEVLRVGVDHALAAVETARAAAGGDAAGAELLAEAIVAYVNCIVAESNFTVANIRCYNEAPPGTREQLRDGIREFTDTWAGLLANGQADGSLRADVRPQALARLMISGLNSVASWYRPGGGLQLDELGRQFADTIVNGLRP